MTDRLSNEEYERRAKRIAEAMDDAELNALLALLKVAKDGDLAELHEMIEQRKTGKAVSAAIAKKRKILLSFVGGLGAAFLARKDIQDFLEWLSNKID